MPDLIIKPQATSGNKVILQDQAGGAVLTTADSGATLGNSTQDNITRLGTVTAGTLGSGVIQNGVTDGSSAGAGQIGEVLTVTGAAINITTSATNALTLSVTAGDWDISAMAVYAGSAHSLGRHSITTTSATVGTFGVNAMLWAVYSGGGAGGGTISPIRFSFTTTTTVYLVAQKDSGSDGTHLYASIYARRMR